MLKRHIIPMVALILVSSLVTGCGTTSQQSPPSNSSVGHCSAQFQPVIQRLTSVRPSSQSIYFISGIHLYALNAGDGTLRWCMYTAYTNSPRPATLGNAASALFREKPLSLPEGFTNLTISNGIIYTGSRDGYTYAFQSSSGTLLWRQNTGFPSVSAPTVVGNTVYVSSGTIYALNAKDGSIRWRYQTSAFNNSSPVIVNGVAPRLYHTPRVFGDGHSRWWNGRGAVERSGTSPSSPSPTSHHRYPFPSTTHIADTPRDQSRHPCASTAP